MMNVNKIVEISASVGVMAALLYFLALAPSIDIVDDVIHQGLVYGTLPPMDAAITLINIETAVLIMAFMVSSILAFKNARQFGISLLAIPVAGLAIHVISTGAMLGLTTYKFVLETAWVNPILFATCILRNTGIYLAIFAILLVLSLIFVLKLFEVRL
jgi:hypothetical protein